MNRQQNRKITACRFLRADADSEQDKDGIYKMVIYYDTIFFYICVNFFIIIENESYKKP